MRKSSQLCKVPFRCFTGCFGRRQQPVRVLGYAKGTARGIPPPPPPPPARCCICGSSSCVCVMQQVPRDTSGTSLLLPGAAAHSSECCMHSASPGWQKQIQNYHYANWRTAYLNESITDVRGKWKSKGENIKQGVRWGHLDNAPR